MKSYEKQKCALCGIDNFLTKHHLIPKCVSHSTKYPKTLKNDDKNFIWICNACHSHIHALYSKQELRDLYFTLELLLAAPEFAKFVSWRKKHPEFDGHSKMSKSNKMRH